MPPNSTTSRSWGKLKSHHFAHKTFRDAHDLDGAIDQAVTALNAEST
jgi:hypothetical protein